MMNNKKKGKKSKGEVAGVRTELSGRDKMMLLDMHAILHRGYHALPDFRTRDGQPTGALYGLVSLLISAIKEVEPDFVIATYDLPAPTKRHKAFKDYKAGRAKTDPELITQIKSSRAVLDALNIPYYELAGYEADDLIGTIAELEKSHHDIIIVSGDMDTLQLVDNKKVQVFTLKRGIKDTVLYNEKLVNEKYGFGPELLSDYKGLRGDPSDNIPGVKGVGEKTATTLIKTFGTIENIYEVLEADKEELPAKFAQAGLKKRAAKLLREQEEMAFFSKMLGTIDVEAPIDFELPEKKWREGIDLDKIDELFTKLQFRTLKTRLRTLLGADEEQGTLGLGLEEKEEETKEEVSEQELTDAQLKLFVLDSTESNPSLEDILEFTGQKDFQSAQSWLSAELEKRDKSAGNDESRGLRFVYGQIERPLTPVLASMNKLGVLLDTKVLSALSKKYHTELEALAKSIYEYAGREFNINSPKQLGEVLFDELGLSTQGLKKTAGGARSTRESELEKLRGENGIIADILEYRELQKLLSTYIDVFPTLLADDGRLHTTFLQTGTSTGRLASRDPNLQNIPVKTARGRKIRDAFVAQSGMTMLALDYSQVELRIAAFLSQDEAMMKVFKDGRDIHSEVAMRIFGVQEKEVDKEMRRRAKVINFGILYGMGVNALHTNLGRDTVTRSEAQAFLDSYFVAFPGLATFMERTKEQARRLGYTETLFGRRRYFKDMNSRLPHIKAAAERTAINAPIQGTSADITKLAMVAVDKWIKASRREQSVRMLLQIHDELIFEVKNSEVEAVAKEIKELMESVVSSGDTHGVPIVVDASAGPDWGHLDKI